MSGVWPVHEEGEFGLHAPPSSAQNLYPSYARQRWKLIGLENGKGDRPPRQELGLPWSSALDVIHPGQGEWKLGLPTTSSASWPSPKLSILVSSQLRYAPCSAMVGARRTVVLGLKPL
ncbi:hypothetical protein Dimus_031752 [Dionaea muscipula]